MATLNFEAGNGCGLPPFNAVSNKLFFFRVNVFEIALPIDQGRDSHSGGGPGRGRLGLPITDLFPNLMPEYGAAMHQSAQAPVRLDRDVFLPATNANRYFSGGRRLEVTPAEVRAAPSR